MLAFEIFTDGLKLLVPVAENTCNPNNVELLVYVV
jgi:hypothetical protein